jgi:hypothetical protein
MDEALLKERSAGARRNFTGGGDRRDAPLSRSAAAT